MNVTKDVILDLYPLYLERECSADSKALVEEYLQRHPRHAEELLHAMNSPLPAAVPRAQGLEEVQSLREARRRVRARSWVLGFAIFLSLAPFSFIYTDAKTYWLCLQSTRTALIYGTAAAVFWVVYAVMRGRSNSL